MTVFYNVHLIHKISIVSSISKWYHVIRLHDDATSRHYYIFIRDTQFLLGCFGITSKGPSEFIANKQQFQSSFSDACGKASNSGGTIYAQPTCGSGCVDPGCCTVDGADASPINSSLSGESESAAFDLLSKQFPINTQIFKPTLSLYDSVGCSMI